MRAQNINVCVNANPKKRNRFSGTGPGAIGIALNGVLIRPGTADYWDPRSRRGHSRNRSSGWNLEGMGAADMLGMDRANAHVDKRGIYHYHGPPNSALKTRAEPRSGGQRTALRSTILVPAQNPVIASRAARVRPGPVAGMTEPTSKTGVYVGGSGTLDQCNGGMLNGKFVYFATNTYPYYPRCLWGRPSSSFRGM